MEKQNQLRLLLGICGVTLIALLGTSKPTDAMPTCGPGSHWVDTCTAGTDSFNSIATIGVDIDFDNIADFNAVLQGPTTIYRGNPINTPDPLDPGHFNQIDTEIVSMTLTGVGMTLTAGDGTGNLSNDGPLHSAGNIIEQAGNPFMADSFFDVFFEFDIPGIPLVPTLHNTDPLRVRAVIDRVPPINTPYIYILAPPISAYMIPIMFWWLN